MVDWCFVDEMNALVKLNKNKLYSEDGWLELGIYLNDGDFELQWVYIDDLVTRELRLFNIDECLNIIAFVIYLFRYYLSTLQ